MKKQTVLIGCGVLIAALAISGGARSGEYDHTTAILSQGRSNIAATSVGDVAIFAGGTRHPLSNGYSDVVDFYDADSGAWTAGSLSVARTDAAAASIGDLAFIAGGLGEGGVSDVVDIYDASTGNWATTALSVPRTHVQATTVGNLVLFAGGQTGETHDSPKSDVVDIYDAGTGAWSTTTMPEPAILGAGASAGTTFIFGGHHFYGSYDSVTGTWDWRDGTMIIDSGCSLGDQAVLTSGWDCEPLGWDDKVYLYDGTTGQWTDASDTCPDHSGSDVTALGRDVFVPTSFAVGELDWDYGPPNSGHLDLVRANWGRTVTPGEEGDWTKDGVVNSADLDLVRAAWGDYDDPLLEQDLMNVLDLDTGTWTTEPIRTPGGETRLNMAAVTVGDTVLFAGGHSGGGIVDIYTPAVSAVPEPSMWLAVACLLSACGLWRRR